MSQQDAIHSQRAERQAKWESLNPLTSIFDRAEVVVDAPERLNLGVRFPCRVTIVPKKSTRVRKVLLEWVLVEEAIVRGTSDSTYRTDGFVDARTPIGATTLEMGRTYELAEEFSVPLLGPPTFYGANHSTYWILRLRLDVPWWPDTRSQRLIKVEPCLVEGV